MSKIRICPECDWVVELPPLAAGQHACCPRCQHTLAVSYERPAQQAIGYSIAGLVLFLLALPYPFVSFAVRGIQEQIVLLDTALSLLQRQEIWLALVIALTVAVIPALFLAATLYVHSALLFGRQSNAVSWPFLAGTTRALAHMKPWMMADVFLLGALISLTKISSSADIHLGPSFWPYCGFAVLVLWVANHIDYDWLWRRIKPNYRFNADIQVGRTAAEQDYLSCHTCQAINHKQRQYCRRCGENLNFSRWRDQRLTLALLVAASILYIPANLFTMMETVNFNSSTQSTILSGVIQLWQNGEQPIAAIIFFASIVVPVAKIAVLFALLFANRFLPQGAEKARTRLYRVTDFIGRWSMIDVFVVAILVALIHAGTVMAVYPGAAAAAFAGVVILTMFAAMSFDSRWIWQQTKQKERIGG
ncbi:paraquat-inducible protein A [Idiomarina xiamenensis]|uniref:Paraquat-inducible protein A n=1 Tax=Idiomarina xiamenensis 10-D-4 TaxID=740709 RepID=K2KN48_9GAMM|nr:paraquat-inducible protein A [Idiomarina xiamenensis]EKE83889.1 Paraquat-inducible protein A [Idiomarina xiamenensis 10-D-4]